MTEIEKYKKTFEQNLERVYGLQKLYNFIKSEDIKEGKEYKFTDILRAAVVFLHASFEEYYRSVLGHIFPKICTEEDLKNISFLGSEGNHKEKITLGGLIKYRDKAVDELISESIKEALMCTSFNNYRDIVSWANKIKIDLSEFNNKAEKLDNLIARRHKIVHEADNSKEDAEYNLTPIRENTLKDWISVVSNLVDIIDNAIQKEK